MSCEIADIGRKEEASTDDPQICIRLESSHGPRSCVDRVLGLARPRASRKRNQSAGYRVFLSSGAINKSREEERIRSPFAASDVNATMLVWMRLAVVGDDRKEKEDRVQRQPV